METYVVLDASGNIINRIVLTDATQWAPVAGESIMAETSGPMAIGGTYISGVYTAPASASVPAFPQTVASQDLIAQFTVADYSAITTPITANPSFGLLWSALQAQGGPMIVTNARFLAGWSALVTVLGQARMTAIASALNVTVT